MALILEWLPTMSPVPASLPPDAAVRCFALLPCAGQGARAGGTSPKQYQPVLSQPMVMHTLAAFQAVARIAHIWLVVAPGDNFLNPEDSRVTLARCGGRSRAESVFNGLQAMRDAGARETDWVLVHDAARCLVTPAQITALMDACEPDPVGGLLALKLPDTLKAEAGGRVVATIDRADKWLAQTPQMFRIGLLQAALQAQAATAFAGVTDEASAMELAGHAPRLVPGSAQNFKVTYPEDFALAEAILRSRA